MKRKLLIAGIGGVGGYFGGLLAKHYENSSAVDIIFLARGNNLKQIQENGLKIIDGAKEFVVHPALATDDVAKIGFVDYVIVATKSYDLEAIMEQLQPCMSLKTVIIPLLNGVDSKEKIKRSFPENLVLDGCAYIVSRLQVPGVIEKNGAIEKIYFGLDDYEHESLRLLLTLFTEAGIEAHLSKQISRTVWEKFVFLSPLATATSYYDTNVSGILENEEKLDALLHLVEEIKQVAKVKNIALPEDITTTTLSKYESLPSQATTSMHSDFKNKKSQNELASITTFVVNEAIKHGVDVPFYKKMNATLQSQSDALFQKL